MAGQNVFAATVNGTRNKVCCLSYQISLLGHIIATEYNIAKTAMSRPSYSIFCVVLMSSLVVMTLFLVNYCIG